MKTDLKLRLKDGMDYMWYALTAFLALGMEGVLGFVIEPVLYKGQMAEWKPGQIICHWCLTIIIWSLFSLYVIRSAKKEKNFDLFQKSERIIWWKWVLIVTGVVLCLVSTWIDWNGSKVLTEYAKRGTLLFTFQYIYYFFEVILVLLIIIFGQIAAEKWFQNANIPYGGIVVALTWGLGHWATKGSLFAGIYTAIGGFVFGSVYLLTNRNAKLSYILLCIMFIL